MLNPALRLVVLPQPHYLPPSNPEYECTEQDSAWDLRWTAAKPMARTHHDLALHSPQDTLKCSDNDERNSELTHTTQAMPCRQDAGSLGHWVRTMGECV